MENQKIRLNNIILHATLILFMFSLIMVFAASGLKSYNLYNFPYHFVQKHFLVGMSGLCTVFFIQIVPISWIKNATTPLVLFSLGLGLAFFATNNYITVGGATRWIQLGPIRFQPSEIYKLSVIMYLSLLLSDPKTRLNHLSGSLLKGLVYLAIIAFFLMSQPDFGTTVLLLSTAFILFYIKGLKKGYIGVAFVFGALGVAASIAFKPYRVKRLLAFLDPWAHKLESGFQIIQSYIALNNGGLWGLGFGESKQKLFYLPEPHTDFILSVVGEELGIIGLIFVLSLLFLIAFSGFIVAKFSKDYYLKFITAGISSLLSLQTLFNYGVVLGVLPTKGIPLPIVSYGSTSLIVYLTMIGILARASKEVCFEKPRKNESSSLYRNFRERYATPGKILPRLRAQSTRLRL